MDSDESGSRRFTFSVYFRPEDLSADLRQKLLDPKAARALVHELFAVKASAERQQRMTVDPEASHFCAGTSDDGAWRQKDPNCKDDVRVKATSAPADYVTVLVTAREGATAKR